MKAILVTFLMLVTVAGTGSAQIPLQMSPYWHSMETGGYSTGANWGDIDKNGFLDWAISRGNDMALAPNYVYFNYGGTLQNFHTWASTNAQYSGHSALGDVDQDGYLDWAVSNYISQGWRASTVQLYMNLGGALETSPSWESTDSMHSFACAFGDADGDGDLDLAVACGEAYNTIREHQRIYYNIGGTLETTPSWTSIDSTPCYDVEWGDVDNDGDLDLAFISAIGPLFVYYNYGDSIERAASWNSGYNYNGNTLNWGDLDNDGYLDLAVANNNQLGPPGFFEVYHNVNGTLDPSPIWRSNTQGYGSSVSWCDVDNDGDKDLAAGRWWGYSVIYENTGGDLTNSPTWSSTNTEVVEEMVWADIDGDGVLNVVGEVHAGDGIKKVFYLNHYPAHSLERVIVDGDTLELTEYCYNLASGWISVAAAPVSEIIVDYHYSHKPDLGVSNWGGANFIFRNVAPAYVWGDANGGGDVEVGDIVYLVNYLYKNGPGPVPSQCGDPNDDCVINVGDIVYLLNYLYRGGDAPLPGCAP
ncbi:MAG: FG-GAP-like repeat-containing protein [Candidatus Zixiibacteriota bacterium]